MKFMAKIIGGTFLVIATLFVGCGLLVSLGENEIEKGAKLAEKTGNTLAGCKRNYTGHEMDICKSAVNSARMENAVDDLENLSDALN